MTSRGDFTRPRMRRFARGKAAAGAELGRIAAGAYKPWRAGRVSVSVGSRRKRRARPALHVATRREPPTIGQLADSASSWKAKNAVPQARRATATPKNAAFCRRCATRARRRATRQQGRGRSPGGATAIAAEHKNALPKPRRATATPQKARRFLRRCATRARRRATRRQALAALPTEPPPLPAERQKPRAPAKACNCRRSKNAAFLRRCATRHGPLTTDQISKDPCVRLLSPDTCPQYVVLPRDWLGVFACKNHPSGLHACQTVRAAARPRRRQPAIMPSCLPLLFRRSSAPKSSHSQVHNRVAATG